MDDRDASWVRPLNELCSMAAMALEERSLLGKRGRCRIVKVGVVVVLWWLCPRVSSDWRSENTPGGMDLMLLEFMYLGCVVCMGGGAAVVLEMASSSAARGQ